MIPKKDVIKNHFFAIVVTFLLPCIIKSKLGQKYCPYPTVNIYVLRITMMDEKNIVYYNLIVVIAAEVDGL